MMLWIIGYLVVAAVWGLVTEGDAASPIGLAWPLTLPLTLVLVALMVVGGFVDTLSGGSE
jgi:hypothetical protein